MGLNPCFNGRYSQRTMKVELQCGDTVLILVVMEDTLRGLPRLSKRIIFGVLILVVMEDTLREQDIRILCIGGIGIYKTNSVCPCQQKLTAF